MLHEKRLGKCTSNPTTVFDTIGEETFNYEMSKLGSIHRTNG